MYIYIISTYRTKSQQKSPTFILSQTSFCSPLETYNNIYIYTFLYFVLEAYCLTYTFTIIIVNQSNIALLHPIAGPRRGYGDRTDRRKNRALLDVAPEGSVGMPWYGWTAMAGPWGSTAMVALNKVLITLWLCQNSYWKWPFIVDVSIKMWDFPLPC